MTHPAGPARRHPALVVISGDDVYEDLFTASRAVTDLLAGLGFATRPVLGPGALASDPPPELIVLYTAMGGFALGRQAALAAAVAAGTGLIAIHSANVFPATRDGHLDEDYRTVFELIGSRYVSHGPLPHESRFDLHADPDHPVTRGLGPLRITHEHYHLELAPGTRVLAWRETPAGREPLIHAREHGAGRVCYLQLGHDMRAWDDPGVRQLIRQAATWASHRTTPGGAPGPHHAGTKEAASL